LPPLSATNRFNVVVNAVTNPVIDPLNLSPSQISIMVNGPQGPDYSLLSSSNLTSWQVLFTTNSPVLPVMFTETNSGVLPANFYRVQIGP